MWRTNERIGFDDRLVTVILIPLASFIIPFIFFGMSFTKEPYFTGQAYLNVLIITTVIWLGNRYIMTWARGRYPHFYDTRLRIVVQSLAMLLYTIIANNVLGFTLHQCGFKEMHTGNRHDLTDILTASNGAALFSSLTVVAIYESIYFKKQLMKSIMENENLKRESLHAQLDALRTQVNPHFLFNNLNTLVSIIPEDPNRAVDFVKQLAKVYRHILEVKDEKSIELKEELDVLKAYAFLLKTRFGDNLDITISVPEEKLKRRIIPLSLQILMENAIKHNIVSSEKPLKINVYTQNGRLVVNNNLQKKNQVNECTGIGLDNIRNRYKLLSDKAVEVTENGSDFTVSIPLIQN